LLSQYQLCIATDVTPLWQLRGIFKFDASKVAFAPDNLAGVDSPKVVETEGNGCGKLLDFRVKLNAGTDAGEVVHDTAVNGLLLSKDLSWMKNLRSRQPPAFHYRMILFNVRAIDRHFEQPINR
jgi:hypothetical protein